MRLWSGAASRTCDAEVQRTGAALRGGTAPRVRSGTPAGGCYVRIHALAAEAHPLGSFVLRSLCGELAGCLPGQTGRGNPEADGGSLRPRAPELPRSTLQLRVARRARGLVLRGAVLGPE